MSETLSIRLDAVTKQRLASIAKTSKRSASFLAAEAISAFVEQEEWQIGELRAASEELDSRTGIPHEQVETWMKSWGTAEETNAPQWK